MSSLLRPAGLGLLALGALLAFGRAIAHDTDPPPPGEPPTGALSDLPCVAGLAGPFPCEHVDLLAYHPLSDLDAGFANDLWAWTDPQSGTDYVLLGLDNGLAFFDLTTPTSPVYLGKLPSHAGTAVQRDVKVYGDHALVVSEAPGHGLQIFDLGQLASVTTPPVSFSESAHYDGFGNAHNVAVLEGSGHAVVVGAESCGGGLTFVDVSEPLAPTFAGCFADDGYTHDVQCVVYQGPDTAHQGREICLAANEDTLTIVDVTDKTSPVQLSRSEYSGSGYTHQGWLSEDHASFFLDDEWDEVQEGHNTRTRVWNVSDLDAPILVGHYDGSTGAIDHNQMVLGDHLFQANYRAGLRVLRTGDLGVPELAEVAFFDTYPADDLPSFGGAWTAYPYLGDDLVLVSDMNAGLFVLHAHLHEVARCDDGLDNDGDGLVDYPADPGCAPGQALEHTACNDGMDDDADGAVDFDGGAAASQGGSLCTGAGTPFDCCTGPGSGCSGPADSDCLAGWDDSEGPACGFGPELLPLAPLLGGLLRRRRSVQRRRLPGAPA